MADGLDAKRFDDANTAGGAGVFLFRGAWQTFRDGFDSGIGEVAGEPIHHIDGAVVVWSGRAQRFGAAGDERRAFSKSIRRLAKGDILVCVCVPHTPIIHTPRRSFAISGHQRPQINEVKGSLD